MLLNINSKVLDKLLSKVFPAVPSRTPLTITENFLFEVFDGKLIVTATDLHVTITSHINIEATSDIRIVVPAKLLFEIVKSLDDTTIVFEIEENSRLSLKTEKGVYFIGYSSPEGFPKIPEVPNSRELTLEGKVLKKLIDQTSFAISKDSIRPAMQGMLFELSPDGLKVVSTDGHKLVKYLMKNFEFEQLEQYVIPEKAVSILSKLLTEEPVRLSFHNNYMQADIDNITLVIRLIEQSYPDYNAVIPLSSDFELVVNRAELNSAVKRMLLFAANNTYQAARLVIGNNNIDILAEDIDKGSSGKESIYCTYTGEPMAIGFNSNFLNEVLSHLNSDTLIFKFTSPTKAVIVLPSEQVEGEDIFVLVMPVRLNN